MTTIPENGTLLADQEKIEATAKANKPKRRSPKKREEPAPVVVIRAAHPEAIRIAHTIAGGNRRRIRINQDGSVTVANHVA